MKRELALQILHGMKRIRAVEETIAQRYAEQEMRCPTHLSTGQEGIAALGVALRRGDMAVSGHRAHAHYLAKGGNLNAMIAEIYGKATGCAGGKGGSMHLIDEAAGFMGSTAIVGGTIPVGVGLAYGIRQAGTDNISCIFFGDAALETGVFFESVNFAVVKKLPALFVCENNFYSVYSPLSVRQPRGRKIFEVAKALGLPAESIDGNDAEAVYEAAQRNVAEIRAGSAPRFLELSTYRWREHCGPNFDNELGYRTEAEYLAWWEKEPIVRFEKKLLAEKTITPADIAKIEAEIEKEVNAAFAFAKSSPFPAVESAYEDLYAA